MKRTPVTSPGTLLDVVTLALLAGTLAAIGVLAGLDGWEYYLTPSRVRGYAPQHALLRPSGPAGHLLGIAGTMFLFGTLPYLARKRMKRLSRAGTVQGWLQFHIFCGVFGPILITFHTSFKFNGIISVAYWSMALVVLSGFVGRALYVRIPKSIRGDELTQAELEESARELKRRLADTSLSAPILARIEELEGAVLSGGATRRALRREIRGAGLSREVLHEALDLAHERAVLLRRIARLKRTRQLFQIWHVFHRPLVWVMFVIFFVHLGVAVYFGYTFFGGPG